MASNFSPQDMGSRIKFSELLSTFNVHGFFLGRNAYILLRNILGLRKVRWGLFTYLFFSLTGSKCALCFGYGGYDCITQVCSYIQDFCSRISFRDYTAEFNNTLAAMLHVAQCADETLCKRLHRLYSRNEHVFVMCCSGNMCNRVLACI